MQYPGFSSAISEKTPCPGVLAGPSAKISASPSLLIFGEISGCARSAFISEAKRKELPFRL